MIVLIISKALGFLKMVMIGHLFGVSRQLDIFWAAFTIPDTIFNILVAGAINSAIIPIFATVLHKEGEKEMNLLYKRLNLIFLVSFVIFSIIVFIFAPNIGQALINSKSLNSYLGTTSTIQAQDINLFVTLMRIMLLSPLLLGMSSLITSYLQVRKKFLVTALSPLFYNLAMIVVSMIAVKVFHIGVIGVAISVVVGSALHFLVQVPALISFIKHPMDNKLVINIKTYLNKEVFAVFKLALPRMIGLLGEQVNTFINTIISFTLSAGSLSAFKFAYSLHLFPVQIFTGAVSQVALSNFSEYSAKGESQKFEDSFNKSIKQTLFLILPVIAVLLVLRLPIVRLVYGFDSWWGTVITSWCLALLTLSIFAQSISMIVYRAFYAVHETKLPLIATAVAIVVNLAACYFMTNFFSHYLDWRPILTQVVTQVSHFDNVGLFAVIKSLGKDVITWMTTRNNSDAAVGGLAFATSISWFAEMLVALFLINKKVKIVTFVKTIKPLLPIFLNAVIMTFGMYFVFKLSDFSLDTSRTVYVIIVTILTLVYGALSFSLGCKLFKITEFDLMTKRAWEYIQPFYFKYFKKR